MKLENIDLKLINFFRKISMPSARIALFVVFFWFGILKVFDLSPASELVQNLFMNTFPVISFSKFIILFGIFECLIGLMFLFRGLERAVIPLLFVHMLAAFLPLFMLRDATWSGFLVPTIEGQYIIKNIVIVALAIGISANLHPLKD